MCDVERGQNLLACLVLIRGDESVDIDIRESGCEMGDGLEKNREAGRVLRHVSSGVARTRSGTKLIKRAKNRDMASKDLRCNPLVRASGVEDRYLRKVQYPMKKKGRE
jgi:hypothetical protein